MKFTKQIGDFQAKSNSGELYTVIELQEYDQILTNWGSITEIEGIKRWKTSSGYLLRPLDNDKYQINATNEVIQRV
jgi:type II restriction/modification system DNA methylase subunit YeeA